MNLSIGNVFKCAPSVNTTFSIDNVVAGRTHSCTLFIIMGATIRTLTFPTYVKWQGGIMPDMTKINKTYILTFTTIDTGATFYGVFGGEF